MKKIFIIVIIILALAAIGAAGAYFSFGKKAAPTAAPSLSAAEKYRQSGGQWTETPGPQGISAACLHIYSDGGKACTASSQCQGACLVSNPADTSVGACKQDDNPSGCYQSLEAARSGQPVLCVD